jgi:aromatic-L-amino-acid decarboxylase
VAPEAGTPFAALLGQFRDAVVPGITHWNHPGFFGYFAISGSAPGILAESLIAALNVNAMLWRASPSATELEQLSTDWLRQMIGLPEGFVGHIQDTASTSTMVALAVAREKAGFDVRREGLAGRGELPRLRVYCSDQTHSSVDRAAITLGLGLSGVRRVPSDAEFRLPPAALIAAIEEDMAAGIRPIAVVATLGTTSTTSIDPVDEIAEICERYGIWLHADAAYGGAAAVVPEMRSLMRGWERADSIVTNPHKWLFTPIDCSVLFFRDPARAAATFSLVPEYLVTPEGSAVTNLMDYGPALGRRFRALKLWMVLGYFGRAGLAARITEHMRLARLFAEWVSAAEGWEVMAPVPFSTVCFRYVGTALSGDAGDAAPGDAAAGSRDAKNPGRADVGDADAALDRVNEAILERVNASGEVFLSHTRLGGRFVLRLAVGNIRSEERHLARAWELLRGIP